MSAYLNDIEKVIRQRFRCAANHRQTIFVHEKTANGKTVWFGEVEVFDLTGCRDAEKCYAWQCPECGVQVVTVLHSNLVDSAHRAVQAAIFSGVQAPLVALTDDPKILRLRIQRARQALHETGIKAGDLEAVTPTTQRTHEFLFPKRQ